MEGGREGEGGAIGRVVGVVVMITGVLFFARGGGATLKRSIGSDTCSRQTRAFLGFHSHGQGTNRARRASGGAKGPESVRAVEPTGRTPFDFHHFHAYLLTHWGTPRKVKTGHKSFE